MAKIKKIHVKNIKSIIEQKIDLNGCSAIITAGNNKGKSTLLTALTDRIRGQKPDIILREGEKEGSAEIELVSGERFLWELKGDKEKLTFFTQDGLKKPLKREISKRFFAEKFDIDKFLNETPKKQSEMLLRLLGVDLSDLAIKYDAAYEDRTYKNRNVLENKARIVPIDNKLAEKEIDITEINTKYKNALTSNNEIEAQKTRVTEIEKNVLDYKEEIDQLVLSHNEKLIKINNKIDSLVIEKVKIDTSLKKSKKINTEELAESIKTSQKTNDDIRKNNDAKKITEKQKTLEKEAFEADKLVKSIIKEKQDRLSKTDLPDGIQITQEGLRVDGLPFDRKQLSLSKIYITALKLASLNLPEVKTLYFDASALDKNSLLEIQEWANSKDYQLLIEKPDFDGGEIQYQVIKEN